MGQYALILGIVPENASMVAMPTTGEWSQLTPDERRYQAKRMAVYAGMVEAMDFHLGRLIEHLEEVGKYENTIFIFTSDNGSEPSEPVDPASPLASLLLGRRGYSVDYETLGLKGSFNTIGPAFASAAASPLAYYKFYLGEGGLRVPLIIAGVPLEKDAEGAMTSALTWVTDLTPTILDLSGTDGPGKRYGGRVVEPIIGRSLVPLIEGRAERVYGEGDTIGTELAGHAALFQGDFKIVRNRGPVGDGAWHLYDIVNDPGETTDLAHIQPMRLQQMLARYDEYVERSGVLPVPSGYDATRQIAINGLRERAGPGLIVALLLAATLIPFLVFSRMRRRSESE